MKFFEALGALVTGKRLQLESRPKFGLAALSAAVTSVRSRGVQPTRDHMVVTTACLAAAGVAVTALEEGKAAVQEAQARAARDMGKVLETQAAATSVVERLREEIAEVERDTVAKVGHLQAKASAASDEAADTQDLIDLL